LSETALILAIVGIYLVALLVIGGIGSRRVRNTTDFVVAGRRLGLALCTSTLFATWFGGGTLIGAAGAAYSGGLSAVVADPFGASLCLLIAGAFYVRLLRRLRLITISDFFRRRFGKSAEILSALVIFPAYIGWVGSQLIAVGTILTALTDLNATTAVLVAAGVVLLYTTLGGMWSVTLTDFFQVVILVTALLVMLPIVLGAAGGAEAAFARLTAEQTRFAPTGGILEWCLFVQAWLVIGLGNLPAQDLMQRALSSKDEWVAQWSAYIAGAMYLLVGLIPVTLGLVGTGLLPVLDNPGHIVPLLAMEFLPPVAFALFLGALFAALMSSADSGLLGPASVFGQNILKNIAPDLSPRERLIAIRVGVVFFCGLALSVALVFEGVYTLMVESWTIIMVGLFAPLTLGMYWKRANGPGAVVGILAGIGIWLITVVASRAAGGADFPGALLATGASLGATVLVSLATGSSHPPRKIVDIAGKPVEPGNRLGVLGLRRRS